MVLRDHFHVPPNAFLRWPSIHSAWCVKIMEGLNNAILPPQYSAIPNFRLGTQAQVDIGTVEPGDEVAVRHAEGNGGVITAVWAPPKPPLVLATDLADLDVIEIAVCNHDQGSHLVAAIELISPANKDRPSHRRAFAAKCAAMLQQEVSVVLVDIVTDRNESLHDELMDLLDLGEEAKEAIDGDLYAIAYRAVANDDRPPRLEIWPHSLAVGGNLPVLPLWIAPGQAVPVDLQASYSAALKSLRIR